jgi:hypothetical protein
MPSVSDDNPRLSMDTLENAVRAADASALFVPAWLLQKLAAYDRGPGANVFALPRAQAHLITRERLLEIVQREELPLAPPAPGRSVLLLARPETDQLASTSASEMLLRYWRLMFNARAKSAMQSHIAAAPFPRAAVQERIEQLSRSAFNEARYVLMRERYLLPAADDIEAYAEFAALYLEFTSFCPTSLPYFFPAMEDSPGVLEMLKADIDWQSILKATRPAGATDSQSTLSAEASGPASIAAKPRRRARRDASHRDKLLAKAIAADARGNDVRAAIFRIRVYRAAGTSGPSRDSLTTVYADALKDLDQLTARLKAALALDDSLARQWRARLVALLENAAGGWWNAEGRLLYDLQKVCVYHEREIYSVSVVDYVVNFARRPLRRPQPGQRLVLAIKSLRSALRRTARVCLPPNGRAELQRLLLAAIDDAEERLRNFLRAPVNSALDAANLQPTGTIESVAHVKLSEELLDEIVHNGYLTFPAVRDTVSRNQMKLNDLSKAQDFARGDQLLLLDRKLEDNLDYVYHRGEIYLRGFHRLSSIFFATHTGRILTKFIILPVGGAFVVLEALDHSVGLLIHKLAGHAAVVTPGTGVKYPPIFFQFWLFAVLSVFLFGLINIPAFRSAVATGFKHFFRFLRVIFIDLPRLFINLPFVQAIIKSQFARLVGRYILKPLIVAGIAYVLVPNAAGTGAHAITLGAVFIIVNLLLNSRAGRAIEQAILHSLRTTFARFTWDILVALIRGIVQIFQSLLEAIDRLLYAVDELLRFRAGQKKSTIVAKAIVGVVWFFIAYITRFVINLLVEPQFNPIKHFPVVTVSHKMILPTTPYIAHALQSVKIAGVGIEASRAWATAGLITLCTPGIFGFLAWEFRENWKLYKANRSKNLKPILIGSHGETLATFLRPGFHSGTIPKIFHRLRKAQLRAAALLPSDNKHLQAAHHVEESLQAFFNREFIALVNRHPLFQHTPIALGAIHLAVTQIHVELQLAQQAAEPLVLSFEQRAGWIIAGIDQPGWTAQLSGAPARQFSSALLGLYKLCGIDIVREQIRALFSSSETRFDFRKNDLIVWPTADFSVEAAYDLSAEGVIHPRFTTPPQDIRLPALTAGQILFRNSSVPRESWIRLWESQGENDPAPGINVSPVATVPPTPQAVTAS